MVEFLSSFTRSGEAAEHTDCFSADSPNECPGNDTKQSDGEIPVMLELWGILVPL